MLLVTEKYGQRKGAPTGANDGTADGLVGTRDDLIVGATEVGVTVGLVGIKVGRIVGVVVVGWLDGCVGFKVGGIVGAVGKLVGIAATYIDAPWTITWPLHCPLSSQPSDNVYI